MKQMYNAIARFVKDEEGVAAVEYGLIAALIAVVIVATVVGVGQNLDTTFQHIRDCLASTGGC